MDNTKVLLFTDTFCDINGVSRFVQDLSLMAEKENIAFFVVTSSVKTCSHYPNVKVFKPKYRMKIPFYKELDLVFPSYEALYAYTESISPDVIHISTPGFVGWMGRKIASEKGIPMAGTYHTDFSKFLYSNVSINILYRMTNKVMQYFYKDFSALFVRSAFYKNIVEKEIKVPFSKIHTLQAGIDTYKFNPSYKDRGIWKKYGIPSDATIALYVGRLTKEKNFQFLLDIWKDYYSQTFLKNVYLVVVGGTLKDDKFCRQYHIKSLGVKKGEELSSIYASSDFFLFPSTTDTLGQVVMEAMSSGLPVIVSDEGGPKSLLDEQRKRGFSISTEDPKQWLDTIEELHLDTQERKHLGKNGTKFMENMTIEKSFHTFFDLHRNITLQKQ